MSLRNRLVMSSMETMYGTPDGLPSERTRDYFAARAKFFVGLSLSAQWDRPPSSGPDELGPEMHGVTSIGPSVIPSYLTGRPSAEVTGEQLVDVLDLFKPAVRRAAEAGYDRIELHAAHGYMFLGSFLAPQRNRRTDDYRGDTARGRVRVVLEALAAIRSEIGDDLPITLRISGYERVAGGRPILETAQVAPELVAAGVAFFMSAAA